MTIPLPIRNYLRANQLIQHLYFDWHLADIPVLLGSKSFREKSYSLMELYLNHDELQNEALLRGCLKTIVNGSEFSESDNDSCNHEHFVG